MPISAFSGTPSGIYLLDPMTDGSIDGDTWDSEVVVGSTTVIAMSDRLQIKNTGAGTQGISYLPTALKFGKQCRISADVAMAVGSAGADGNHAEAGLELFLNSDNYIIAGPYRDAAGGINDRCYVRGKIGGVALGPIAAAGINTDSSAHTVTMVVLDTRVLVLLDGQVLYSMPFELLTNYIVEFIAGTTSNADKVTADYVNFEVCNQFDIVPLQIGVLAQSIYAGVTSLLAGSVASTSTAANAVLTSTTAVVITFAQSAYGGVFDLAMFLDISGATIKYCRLNSGATWWNYDIAAKNYETADILLVPAAGATIADAIYFMLDRDSQRLDVSMLGGVVNTDNTFIWEYWNGAAWATLTGLVDGTVDAIIGKVFSQSGSVTWTNHLSSNTVNGVTGYPVRARVSVAGVSTPIASHIQFSPINAVDFDSLGVFGTHLDIEVYRKQVGGTYPLKPNDVWSYQQGNIQKNINIEKIRCYTDTKIVLTLESTPTAPITIPYSFNIVRVSV